MRRQIDASKASVIVVALLTGWCLTGLQSTSEAAASTVTLTQTIHFVASDGSAVAAEAGTYQVDVSASQLSLTAEGRAPLLLEAKPTAHGEKIQTPLALTVPGEDADLLHVVLLLPNGQALDAPGSLSGTRTRASGFPVATLSQIQVAAMQVPQSPVRRDHRGEPQQMPAPSSPPAPGFGTTKTPTSTLALFRMLELRAAPPKFLANTPIEVFILVYQCKAERTPCSARQDMIEVTWTSENQIVFPRQVLYGAGRGNCPADVYQTYQHAGCLIGTVSETAFGKDGSRKRPLLGNIFQSALSFGPDRVANEFPVVMTQPRPYLKFGSPQVRDHR